VVLFSVALEDLFDLGKRGFYFLQPARVVEDGWLVGGLEGRLPRIGLLERAGRGR